MTNADVARVFNEIADLLEIQGADSFRISSYRRVARTIEDLAVDIHDVAARGDLTRLAGVGKTSAQKIQELLDSGELTLRRELGAAVPETLLELRAVPGLGPRKIALFWRECGVQSLADLKAALADGRLGCLKGIKDKTLEQIRTGIEFLERSGGRVRIGVAAAIARAVREALLQVPGVQRVEIAGSLRRGRETIGDLDLLCATSNPAGAGTAFRTLPGVQQVLGAGDTKSSIVFEYRPRRTIQIDLRVVPAASFGAAWQYFTGSKDHNVRLRELAVRRGWSLNEYGLTEGQRVIAAEREEDIYAALGLPCFPPELREDRGEFELTALPDLLAQNDIRGDLHAHTVDSDGVHQVEELAQACRARGYEYLAITDHSRSSTIANGLTAQRLLGQVKRLRHTQAGLAGFTLLAGSEVDVHTDGTLDFPDDVLAQLDFVVASLHVGMGRDIEANTRRTLAAIRNPYVNVIAHPTGRLLNKRDAMPLDLEAICREAARTGTALEINASTYRLDLKDQHARLARDMGVTICISTDAHAIDQLDEIAFGVLTARRAGLRAADVLNTRSVADVQAFVRAKRAAALS